MAMEVDMATLMKFTVPELKDESRTRGLRIARLKPELVGQLAPLMCLSGHTATRVAEMLQWAVRPPLCEVMEDITPRAWIARVWRPGQPGSSGPRQALQDDHGLRRR